MTPQEPYIPFDPKYYLHDNSGVNPTCDFLDQKSSNLTDKIIGLYQEIYKRREINTKIISEIEYELIETSSELYQHKFTSFLDSSEKGSLEKKIDLLEKTKWSEIVEYWKDTSKLRLYLLNIVAEYRDIKNKKNLLE